MPGTIDTLIADDEPVVRDGLRRLMEAEADLHVVGDAGTEVEVIELARAFDPDVLLVDPAMDRGRGLEVLRLLATGARSHLRTIVFARSLDESTLVTALRLGVRGIVMKESPTWVLLKGIRSVASGQLWLSHADMASVVDALRRQSGCDSEADTGPRFRLTRRELEIVASVANGESNRRIADRLCIREDTVKRHLWNIFNKLGLSSRLELALFALRHGLGSGSEGESIDPIEPVSSRLH